MTILVTGATGKVAQHLVPSLVRARHPVRAMVHTASREFAVREQGADTVVAAFDDRVALGRAMRGIDTMLLLTPPHERAAQWASAAIAAAREAGVKRIVRISALLAGPQGPSDNNRQHGRTDDEVRCSGIAYVVLRPHFFMQNLLADVATLQSQGKLYAALGDASLAMIDVRDIADAAKRTLIDPSWDGHTFDLTGPASISMQQVADELSRLSAVSIAYFPVSPAEVARQVLQAGLDAWCAQTFHDYLAAYAKGWGDFTTDAIPRLLDRPARSITQFAQDILVPAMRCTTPLGCAEVQTPNSGASSRALADA